MVFDGDLSREQQTPVAHPVRIAQGVAAEALFVHPVEEARGPDPERVPDGREVGWAYCHVPNGSTIDRTNAIESQLERFAPDVLWRMGAPLGGTHTEQSFSDPERLPGDVYYARVSWADGNIAWTSPIRVGEWQEENR